MGEQKTHCIQLYTRLEIERRLLQSNKLAASAWQIGVGDTRSRDP